MKKVVLAYSGGLDTSVILDWLMEEARRSRCESLQLDSNFERHDAQRFYDREGLVKTSAH